jgi:hypothetical protein
MTIFPSPRLLAICLAILLASASLRAEAGSRYGSIVKVSGRDPKVELSPGTGFIVSLKGGAAWIVTGAHVIGSDDRPTVEFSTAPERAYPAVIVNRQPEGTRGLALLKVSNPPASATQSLPGRHPAQGARVQVAGYPAPSGRFSLLELNIVRTEGEELILSQELQAGYSGGPVMAGNAVVGIVFGREQGIGRALRLSRIQGYVEGYDLLWSASGPNSGDDSAMKADPAPPPPAISIAGIWRDNTLGTVSQISQNGDKFTASGSGIGCLGAFRSVSSGTIKNNQVESTYQSTYSQGRCSGSVSSDGRQMTSRCTDSACGEFITTAIRQ